MKCSEVIRIAWGLTNAKKGLIWFGVIPAFFTMLVGLGYLSYQFFAFEISPFFGNKSFDFSKIKALIFGFAGNHTTLLVIFLVVAIIVVLGYFLIPPLTEGGLIGLVSAFYKKKEGVRISDGIAIGTHHYLKMFEYGMAVSTFSFFEFATVTSLSIRHLGIPTWLVILLAILFFVSFLLGFLFIYAQNFIVLESRGLIGSFSGSAKLVVSNLGKTFLMWLLMLLISIRVIINVVLIFLIPLFVAFVANFFVSTIALTLGIILAVVAGFVVVSIAAYLGGVLHVFTTAAWTITFLDLDYQRAEKLLEE
ncbi:MAG: hypothetical protein K9L85_01140 [Candidatus Peribacteraceae bacterium]|nr:hypothetical protein [Candidatus Peribacteraceae bacterium]